MTDARASFTTLNDVLRLSPRLGNPMDTAMAAWLAEIDMDPATGFDWDAFSPQTQAGLERATADAHRIINARTQRSVPIVNHWQLARFDRRISGDPVFAAAASMISILWNPAEINTYDLGLHDGDGALLDGRNRNVLRLDPPPPVDGFWSVTMYSAETRIFVPNAIDRYSVGDRTTGIVMGADGAIEIFMQADEPTDPVERANWLPAPGGPFYLLMRHCSPRSSILTGDWLPPAVVRRQARRGRDLRPRLVRRGRQEVREAPGIAQHQTAVLDLDPPLRLELVQDRGRHGACRLEAAASSACVVGTRSPWQGASTGPRSPAKRRIVAARRRSDRRISRSEAMSAQMSPYSTARGRKQRHQTGVSSSIARIFALGNRATHSAVRASAVTRRGWPVNSGPWPSQKTAWTMCVTGVSASPSAEVSTTLPSARPMTSSSSSPPSLTVVPGATRRHRASDRKRFRKSSGVPESQPRDASNERPCSRSTTVPLIQRCNSSHIARNRSICGAKGE